MIFKFLMYCRIVFAPKNKTERIAHDSLILHHSFELPLEASRDKWIILKELRRTLKRLWSSLPSRKDKLDDFNSLLLNNKADKEQQLARWAIDNFDHVKPKLIINEMLWQNVKIRTKISLTIYLTLLAIPTLVCTLFGNKRGCFAIVFRSFASIFLLLKRVPSEGTFRVFDFIPFSNASNVQYLLIKDFNDQIEVIKVPSVVPLVAHLKNLLTDTFVISTPYQLDELKAFSDSMIYSKIEQRFPKHSGYLSKYHHQSYCSETRKVGFYSHASWLRRKQNHAKTIFGNAELEGQLLEMLSKEMTNSGGELVIFTHPRERDVSLREEVMMYYHSIAKGFSVTIVFDDMSSSSSFEAVDIGIGTMSSILFERLLCGFKTYFFIKGMEGFPVAGSSIEQICFSSEDDLKLLLKQGLGQSSDEFFDQKGISDYRSSSPFYH